MTCKPQPARQKVLLIPVPDVDRQSREWEDWCETHGVDVRGGWIYSASCYLRGADFLVTHGADPVDVGYKDDGEIEPIVETIDGLSDTDRLLMSLYAEFSEEFYCASWMSAGEFVYAEFRQWLARRLRQPRPEYETDALPALRRAWFDAVADLDAVVAD